MNETPVRDGIVVKANFLSRLQHAEHFDVIEAVVQKADGVLAASEFTAPLWEELKACFREEAKLFKIRRWRVETSQVARLDRQRTASIRLLWMTIRYFCHSRKPAEREAAEALRMLMRGFRGVTYLPYTQDSARITAFLKCLHADAYRQAVETLRIGPLAKEAWGDNEAFKRVFRQRSAAQHADWLVDKKTARGQTDGALGRVAGKVNQLYGALRLTDPDGAETRAMGEAIRVVNGQLAAAEAIYARRVASYRRPAPLSDEAAGEADEEAGACKSA